MPKLKVIIFGTGEGGAKAMRRVRPWEEIIAFVDNDPKKQGTQF